MTLPAFLTALFPFLENLLYLASMIVKVVKEKGIEEAGNLRLKDIAGWRRWSARVLKDKAIDNFIKKLEELKEPE